MVRRKSYLSFESKRTPTIVAVAVFALSLLLSLSPVGSGLERAGYDLLFMLRGAEPPPDKVVVVAIDEFSFQELRQQWPWPRHLHAQLIEQLASAGARTIAFDILFAEPSNSEDDAALAAAMQAHGGVFVGSSIETTEASTLSRQITVLPDAVLGVATDRIGSLAIDVDADGFVRHLRARRGDQASLALAAAHHYSDGMLSAVPELLGINFFGPGGTVKTFSYTQLLAADGTLPSGVFEDALVFVGLQSSAALPGQEFDQEQFFTPFYRWGGQPTFGVEIHAQAAATMLAGNGIRDVGPGLLVLLALLLAVTTTMLSLKLPPALAAPAVTLGVLAPSMVLWYMLFTESGLHLSLSYVLLPILCGYLTNPFAHYLLSRKERQFVQSAFTHYVAPRVVTELLSDPEGLQPGGKEAEGSVMFCDLAGFTSLTETLKPREVIDFLNRQLGQFSDVIIEHEGMIDKFIGDAIMANWGVPIAQQDHASLACRAALDILNANDEMHSAIFNCPSVRIGINSGRFIAGNVGGAHHVNYTVLGSEVNTASRLEGVNRVYGTRILVSEATATALGEEFLLREIDTVSVKGASQPIRIFELQACGSDADPARQSQNEAYAAALALYRAGDFLSAAGAFDTLESGGSPDPAAAQMAARCRLYCQNPPGDDWLGVFQLNTK